jgi:hypothetical protein
MMGLSGHETCLLLWQDALPIKVGMTPNQQNPNPLFIQ